MAPDFVPFVQLSRPLSALPEAGESVLLLREGLLRRVRCLQLGTSGPGPAAAGPGPASASRPAYGIRRDCVLLQEDFLAHRGRPHVYLQRIQLNNPTDRVAALQTVWGPLPARPPGPSPAPWRRSETISSSSTLAGPRLFHGGWCTWWWWPPRS